MTSKTYGLAGLRVGWVATKNRAVYEQLASLKDYSTICNGAPNELLAEVALTHRSRLARKNVASFAQISICSMGSSRAGLICSNGIAPKPDLSRS